MSIQGTQVHIDRIRFAFIDLIPLTKRLDRAVANLVLKFEEHVAVIGFIQAVDRGLKAIPGLDGKPGIFSGDESIIDHLWVRDQAFGLRGAVFYFR